MSSKYILVMTVDDACGKETFFHNFTREVGSEVAGREVIANYGHIAFLSRNTGVPKFCLGLYKDDAEKGLELITCLSHGIEESDEMKSKKSWFVV